MAPDTAAHRPWLGATAALDRRLEVVTENAATDDGPMDGYVPVQCACGAMELAYVNATFVENNIVHRSDKCEDLTPAEWPGDVPESVTVTYERYVAGHPGAMNPQDYRAGEHPTDRLDVSLSRAEIALLLRHALPPLLDVESAYELRDVADRAKQSLERALRER